MSALSWTFLGQTGFLFEFGSLKWVVDPYLFDYVEELYGEDLKRNYPMDLTKVNLKDLRFIVITHAHEDHCDPRSIAYLLEHNPQVHIICDRQSSKLVSEWFPEAKWQTPKVGERILLSEEVAITAVPSAHTALIIDASGYAQSNGYLMEVDRCVLYHPGDTIPNRKIEPFLSRPLDYAFMPINERNFFRDERGIIGNMSVREALQWSEQLGVRNMVPTHWDMFRLNSAKLEELDLVAEDFDKVSLLKMQPMTSFIHPVNYE